MGSGIVGSDQRSHDIDSVQETKRHLKLFKKTSWRSVAETEASNDSSATPHRTGRPALLRRSCSQRLSGKIPKLQRKNGISIESSISISLQSGENLLAEIRDLLQTQKKDVMQFSMNITDHLEVGKARLSSNNATGAVMSMKRMKRLDSERRILMLAVEYLQTQEIDLCNMIDEMKEIRDLKTNSGEDKVYLALQYPVRFDLSQFHCFHDEVEKILSTPHGAITETDEELLAILSSK